MFSRARVATATLLSVMLTPVASAQLVATHLSSNSQLAAVLLDTSVVAQGRIGDRAASATYERSLGPSTFSPAVTGQYNWPNGSPVDFRLDFDAGLNRITFTVGGQSQQYTPLADFTDDLFIRTRAATSGSAVRIDQLILDGVSLSDSAQAANNAIDVLWIRGANLRNGFTLTGKSTMTWSTQPSNSNLAYQLKLGHTVPEPATGVLAALGAWALFKRRWAVR